MSGPDDSAPGRDSARLLVDRAIDLEAAGSVEEAMRLYREAIALDPGYPAPHLNLGLARIAAGDFRAAESDFRNALRLRADFPEAWVGLAEALESTGRDDEALSALEKAISLREHYAGALFNASALLRKLGRPEEAETRFDEFAEAEAQVASALHAEGRRPEAVERLFGALSAAPENGRLRRALAVALYGLALPAAGEGEHRLLASLCTDDEISTVFLAAAITSLMKSDPAFAGLLAAAREGRDPLRSSNPEVAAFVRSELLLAALPRMAFMDPDAEAVLTSLRSAVLHAGEAGIGTESIPFEFVCALARHCFFTEYVFAESEDERGVVETIRGTLRASGASLDPRTAEKRLGLVALFSPLSSVPEVAQRLQRPLMNFSAAFRPLVEEQFLNRLREKAIAEALPALTPIDDAVSMAVRAQYEEHPYPLWVSVHRPEPDSIEALERRLRPGRPVRERPRPVRILIAGCGTGHHPLLVARTHADAEILAVDLSRASLSYASRMAQRFGAGNLRFAQADILKLESLTERFSIVESVGVLHHLKDPMHGWRALTSLLEADGLMRIALYSESARAGVRAARAFLDPLGLPLTSAGVRQSRAAILALPADHPAKEVLAFGDFFTLNGCRDLLMHVQERTFTLPRIAECLDLLDLRFLRMECEPQTREDFQARFPTPDAEADLAAWHRFEEAHPRAFRAMYQFWCAKKE